MKLATIFRFELAYELRRRSTWLSFAIVLTFAFVVAIKAFLKAARSSGYVFNSPFVIAAVTVIAGMIGLLAIAAAAGDAATRDVQARMEPLIYTAPIGRAVYLGGRFLAAFAISAMLMAAVPLGLFVIAHLPGIESDLVGPFRPAAYLGAYLLFALPNAFVATALLFSMALFARRALASYLGAAALLFSSLFANALAGRMGKWALAKQLDPSGLTALSELSKRWTPLQKSTLLIGAEGSLLANRIEWIAFAIVVLAFASLRFRTRRHPQRSEAQCVVAIPSFNAATRIRQTFVVAAHSLREVVTSRTAIALTALAALLVLTAPRLMQHLGIPLLPTTARLATLLANPGDVVWLLIPLLIIFSAGELVWREREARISSIADATPVPDVVPFAGRLLGLSAALVVLQSVMMIAGLLAQVTAGYHRFEPGLWLQILFGFELPGYLLIAVLAIAVHVLINQKYVAHLMLIVIFAVTAFAPALGFKQTLLLYGSDLGWQYSDMSGFDPFVGSFLWFKAYWTGWALLFAVLAKSFWVRGVGRRRLRLTRAARWTLVTAAGVIVVIGSFIFINQSHDDLSQQRAEYERLYRRYASIPQPQLTGTALRVELFPTNGTAIIEGIYRLENKTNAAIGAIHLATAADVETDPITIDRPFASTLVDTKRGHRIYALRSPLQPGESLRLTFRVRYRRRLFVVDDAVVRNGTHVDQEWLPKIGYQSERELSDAGERKEFRLPARPEFRSLDEIAARHDLSGRERIAFDAVVGTDANQIAIAPGTLRRSWIEHGRRYFHYVAEAPIRNSYAFYSAAYAVRNARWDGVTIQLFHHPDHAANLDRIARAAQASIADYSEKFGPYPYRELRLIETPGDDVGLHADPMNIRYSEGFAQLNPDADARNIDFPFAVIAHEVAHQWWGNQLTPAPVEGAPVLTESLAWYSALGVVERTYGAEHLRRFLDALREAYLTPNERANVPLLRAGDRFVAYRKGPFVMYALREYLGEQRVNLALRRLLDKHRAGTAPLPTTRDLYAELQQVTPPELRSLLVDLFEVNTFWDLSTKQANAEAAGDGTWRVTLNVSARKVAVDPAGLETERPMNDLIEIGVFGRDGKALSLQTQRIHSGQQFIRVIVPRQPARAGIDPRNLLIDTQWQDNSAEVRISAFSKRRATEER